MNHVCTPKSAPCITLASICCGSYLVENHGSKVLQRGLHSSFLHIPSFVSSSGHCLPPPIDVSASEMMSTTDSYKDSGELRMARLEVLKFLTYNMP